MRMFKLGDTEYKTNDKGNYFYKSTGKTDKNGYPVFMRIPAHVFEKAFEEYVEGTPADWEEQADAEYEARQQEQEKKDRETEERFNGKKKDSELPDGFRIETTWDGDTYSYALYKGDELVMRSWRWNEAVEEAVRMSKKDTTTKKASKPRRSKDVAVTVVSATGLEYTITAKQADFIKALRGTYMWENGVDSTIWCDCIADEIKWNPMSVGAMISTLREKALVAVAIDDTKKGKLKYMEFTTLGKAFLEQMGLGKEKS